MYTKSDTGEGDSNSDTVSRNSGDPKSAKNFEVGGGRLSVRNLILT